MTVDILCSLDGERVWHDETGWHAATAGLTELIRGLLAMLEVPAHVPCPQGEELATLLELVGPDVLLVEYIAPRPNYDNPDIDY